ncbi:MAG: DUF2314 domain-containing protein [Chlorobia bacterium]|nr:DUF2314 domain-containing protein [Fimbriimonadaceae bacterium]
MNNRTSTFNRFSLLVVASSLILTSVSCQKSATQETVYREGNPPVSSVSDDDPEMNKAIQKARDTLNSFIAELKKQGNREFAVKAGLSTPEGGIEHIWIDDPVYDGNQFKGKLGNEPLRLKDVKLGDPIVVEREKVSDWIIMDGEKMTGGYTAKVLMEREEAKK